LIRRTRWFVPMRVRSGSARKEIARSMKKVG